MRIPLVALALAVLAPAGALTACLGTGGAARDDDAQARAEIEGVLDAWHLAAARADGASYFGAMTEDAVFLGTDASERWSLAEFRAFCEPYFARGIGWTYLSRERHVAVVDSVAWLDERLWNDEYGECRGTGVLRREAGAWRIAHYSLTLTVPNEVADDVVELIRAR